MNVILVTPPASEPVTLIEAKTWLRVDTSDEDGAISALIVAARQLVEAATRRALIAQSWRLVLDRWPFWRGGDGSLDALVGMRGPRSLELDLPLAPVTAVPGARVYDSGGQPQPLATSLYALVGAPERARLVFSAPPPAPGVPAGGIEIDVAAGYGLETDVPAALRQAMLLLVADWYENRGDVDATAPETLPKRVAALVAPWRRGRLA
ncbi:MAG: head-tail connector protein [Hyphomicrobiales bacterium]|nr:head-tail connector protein [Hyphomicrobiales bacterium]